MRKIKNIVILLCVMSLLFILIVAPAYAAQKKFINIGTATVAGIFYPLGTSLAAVLNEYFPPDIIFSAEATAGSAQNVELLRAGEVKMALISNGPVYEAVNGIGAFEGKEAPFLRGITKVYSNKLQVVVRKDSGIDKIEDLKGKRVSVGAPGSGHEAMARYLFNAYGMKIENDIEAEYLGVSETTAQLRDGFIDAGIFAHSAPSAAIMEVFTTGLVKIISLSEEGAQEMAKLPTLEVTTVPAGTYTGLDYNVLTVGNFSHLYVTEDTDEELVYDITKTIFENISTLEEEFATWGGVRIEEAALGMPAPLHPGAERYLKEKGAL